MGVKIRPSSTILREQWFYDDLALGGEDEDGIALFVRHFVEYQTKGGKVHRRRDADVLSFATWDQVRAWIDEHGAIESDDPNGEDRAWVPDEWAGAVR